MDSCARLEIFSLLGAWRTAFCFPTQDSHPRGRALRRWLARADDATYESSIAFVEREDGLPHGMRGWRGAGREAIAYLFPVTDRFFEHAAAELASGRRPARCDRHAVGVRGIGARLGDGDLDRNALVIARVLGEAGFAILASQPTAFVGVARALTAYVSPDAAAALARFASNRMAHPILRTYFTRHPELAGALEPLVDATDPQSS